MSRDMLLLGAGKGAAAFSPDQLSGLVLWLKADSLGLSDGDPVGTWADSGSATNDVLQATSSAKPTLQTAELNGKPVVRWDDVDDALTRADDADFDFGTGNFSAFVVAKVTSGGTDVLICKDNAAAADNGVFLYCDATNYLYWNGSSDITIGPVGAEFKLICVVREGTGANQLKTYLDGTAGGAGTESRTLSNSKSLAVGASADSGNILGGDIAEILVYNTNLGTTDRQSVETYLNSKYALF